MNTITNRIIRFLGLGGIAALIGYAQLTTTSTTTTSAVGGAGTNIVCIASATGVLLPSVTQTPMFLGVDAEAMQVMSLQSTLCYNVKRGQLGTMVVPHASGATVWIGNPATGTGDSSRPFSGGAFAAFKPQGSCTASAQYTLPVIVYGTVTGNQNGNVYTCTDIGVWAQVGEFWISPRDCAFAPTTLTTTNTYVPLGASNIMVMNGTSNAAAGTNTLVCTFMIPTNVTTNTGASIIDISLLVGFQTAIPTSLGTSTLGTVTFPAAATGSVTGSTVTPVAAGGTVTTLNPTIAATTAGSFVTYKHTYSAAIKLSTDRQVLMYTMPFLQSAASAMTVNTAGLLVHYVSSPAY